LQRPGLFMNVCTDPLEKNGFLVSRHLRSLELTWIIDTQYHAYTQHCAVIRHSFLQQTSLQQQNLLTNLMEKN